MTPLILCVLSSIEMGLNVWKIYPDLWFIKALSLDLSKPVLIETVVLALIENVYRDMNGLVIPGLWMFLQGAESFFLLGKALSEYCAGDQSLDWETWSREKHGNSCFLACARPWNGCLYLSENIHLDTLWKRMPGSYLKYLTPDLCFKQTRCWSSLPIADRSTYA